MERLPIDATMGERIRYYRQVAGLTQKALAEKCGITESAIRNYELGNRMPDWETLTNIAAELEVSYFALSYPELNAMYGALHTFFRLEDIYGLHPEMVDGKVHLVFNDDTYEKDPMDFEADAILQHITTIWAITHGKYKAGEMDEDHYRLWKSKFPSFAAPDGTFCSPEPEEPEESEEPATRNPLKRFRRPKKN